MNIDAPRRWFRRPDPVSFAALIVALVALISSLGGTAPARSEPIGLATGRATTKPKPKPKRKAKAKPAKLYCPVATAVDIGTWCIDMNSQPVPAAAAGTNNYFYAAQTCAKAGGWLPSAAQLIGAAPMIRLQSTVDDDPTTSAVEEFQNSKTGFKDKREMSSDLFTTTAGSDAAGSEGVTEGSQGSTAIGEPSPTPAPANPSPSTLDYVTVYDNHNQGGFAGGESVGTAESFRCAYGLTTQEPKRN